MTRKDAIEWLSDAWERRCSSDSLGVQSDSFGMTHDRMQLEEALSLLTDSERWQIRVHCWTEVLDRKLDLAATSSNVDEFARWAPFEALVQAALDVVVAGFRPGGAWAYYDEELQHGKYKGRNS